MKIFSTADDTALTGNEIKINGKTLSNPWLN